MQETRCQMGNVFSKKTRQKTTTRKDFQSTRNQRRVGGCRKNEDLASIQETRLNLVRPTQIPSEKNKHPFALYSN